MAQTLLLKTLVHPKDPTIHAYIYAWRWQGRLAFAVAVRRSYYHNGQQHNTDRFPPNRLVHQRRMSKRAQDWIKDNRSDANLLYDKSITANAQQT